MEEIYEIKSMKTAQIDFKLPTRYKISNNLSYPVTVDIRRLNFLRF